MTTIWWLRRDLRLADNPALTAAAEAGPVLPVFIRDERLEAVSTPRTARLAASLTALNASTDGALVVRSGDPGEVLAELAREVGADAVHVSAEFTPYALRRDRSVAERLAADGVTMTSRGCGYAVRPGTVLTGGGTPYQVFTPFSRAWREHAATSDALPVPASLRWKRQVDSEELSTDGVAEPAGEEAALAAWREFLDGPIETYDETRDRPDLDGTSRASVALRFGEIHPRTMLADLADSPLSGSPGATAFVTELAWREFYADVLWHRPESRWADLRDALTGIDYDEGPETEGLVEAWRQGRTGYPFVDAGMRQLRETGWMHNRLRMVTASFLTKDLHVWWPHGARYFAEQLLDFDVASNNHGWQWVAGTGTDASPYFRVFNPVTQGKRFDPDGDYVRRWVPELAHLPGAKVHEPWKHTDGYADGYPERIVDHDEERRETLDRYERVRR